MPIKTAFVALISVFLFSFQSQAQVQCAEVFERDVAGELQLILSYSPHSEFSMAKMDLSQSVGLKQANDNVYNMVVKANELLDHVVEVILQLNFMPMPKEVKQLKSLEAEVLVEDLQRSFGIRDNAMQAAIHNRVEAEIAVLQAKSEAMEIRRAIGFGRDQSSQEFHAEKPEPHPIGFGRVKKETIEEFDAPVEKIPMGFGSKQSKEKLEDTIEDIVESVQTPIGFTPLKVPESAEPVKSEPIGFVRPKEESDYITEGKLHKIGFDVEKGEFEFIKGDH